MAHALIGVTKKYGNLVMCYVDDVVIATPTLEDHIERLDEVFACMKRSELKCKLSKCETLKDSIKYLGRIVDRHGIRPDPDAVEAVLTWKSPKTEHQLMSFLGFANYYGEFIKCYADKVYPMQQLMRHKGKKFTWNNAAEESFQRIKKELCEAPVLGMPTEKGMYVLDTDAEMKYGAPKAEMLAVVEKYRAYLGSEPFKLRVDNRALSWLKTYSMDQSYSGRWIVRLDGYNMIIEHRTRDKHPNADSLSKKTEFYERQKHREANRPEIKEGFSFMDKETYDSLPLTRWLDKSGKPIQDHPELPEEPPEKTILKKTRGMPIGIMLKSKIVRETLKAKSYDLNKVETGEAQIDEELMRLLEKLAEDEPVIEIKGKEEPEVTILRGVRQPAARTPQKKVILMVKKLCSHLWEKSLMTYSSGLELGKRKLRLRRKLNTMEQIKSPGSGGPQRKKMLEKENFLGSVKNGMKIRRVAATTRIVCA